MEALRNRLIVRSGYPRHGALSQASRDSKVAQSQLSRIIDGTLTEPPKPDTLKRLAEYFGENYNVLLLEVLGDGADALPSPRHPVTPHEQALRVVDVMAAAMVDLRRALEAMAPPSQSNNGLGKDHSPTQSTGDYVWQEVRPLVQPVRVLFALPVTPGLGGIRLQRAA